MANFKSSSRGGRFRRRDQGDLGLQALSRQQKDVVNFLEREARQAKQLGDERVAALRGVANTERENARIIQSIENDVYTTKKDAITVRGTREVEALEQKAKELRSSAKYWSDFTGTGAANIGKGAASIEEYVANLRADQQYKANKHGLDRYRNDLEELSKITETDLVLEQIKSVDNDPDGTFLLNRRRGNTNRFLIQKEIGDFKQNSTVYYKEIRRKLDEINDGLVENEQEPISNDDIPEFYEYWAKEYLEERGLSLNTKQAREFIDKITDQGIQVMGKTDRKQQYKASEKLLFDNFDNLSKESIPLEGEDQTNIQNSLASYLLSVRQSWTYNSDTGEYTRYDGDKVDAVYDGFIRLAKRPDVTREQLEAWLNDVNVPGENTSYAKKFEYRNLESDVWDAFADRQNANHKRDEVLDNVDDRTFFDKKVKPQLDTFDVSTAEGQKEIAKLIQEAENLGHVYTLDQLHKRKLYTKDTNVSSLVQLQLRQFATSGDKEGFLDIFESGKLNNQDRAKLRHILKGLDTIDRKALEKSITTTATIHAKQFQYTGTTSTTVTDVVEHATNDIISRYLRALDLPENIELSKNGKLNTEQLLIDITNDVTEQIKNGEGIYQREERGDINDYIFFKAGGTSLINDDDAKFKGMRDTLSKTDVSSGEGKKTLERYLDGKDQVLSDKQLAAIQIDINNGGTISYPEEVLYLADISGLKPRVVMNGLLKAKNQNRLEVPEQHKYVGPSPQEILKKLYPDKKVNNSKNTNYCSAELLYNTFDKDKGILQKASMGFNLIKDSRKKQKAMIDYFKNHSDLKPFDGDSGEGDYYFTRVTNRGILAPRRVVPTSVKATKYLLREYKNLGLTLNIDGTMVNFTKCTFDWEES